MMSLNLYHFDKNEHRKSFQIHKISSIMTTNQDMVNVVIQKIKCKYF